MSEQADRDQIAAALDMLIAVIAVEICAEERDENDKQRIREFVPPLRRVLVAEHWRRAS